MIPAEEDFDGTWPFQPRFSDAPGFKMHYVDEGSGETLVCLHGQPTWGYLYRNFIHALSPKYRVVVPDHMGFGKSETPQDREYTLRTHVENFTALVEDLDLKDITLVMQDWGGPIGIGFAVKHPVRVKRLCLMNTMCGYGVAMLPPDERKALPRQRSSPWFEWVTQGLEDGTYDAMLGNLGDCVLSIMKRLGFGIDRPQDETWIRAYSAPFPDRASCLGAIEFPKDVALARITEYVMEGVGGVPAIQAKPAMLAEGMLDRAIQPDLAMGDFKNLWPNAPIVQIPRAGHFCQEDAPEVLTALIDQFVQMT